MSPFYSSTLCKFELVGHTVVDFGFWYLKRWRLREFYPFIILPMGLVKECQPLYHAGRIYSKYPPSVERSHKLSKGGIIVLALVSFQFSVFIQYCARRRGKLLADRLHFCLFCGGYPPTPPKSKAGRKYFLKSNSLNRKNVPYGTLEPHFISGKP